MPEAVMHRTTTTTHASNRPLRHLLRTLSVACLLLGGPAASAQITTVPSGLNPGDQYRLIFVTSNTRNATSPNMADYNAFVTSVANSQPGLAYLNTQWFAVGGTATIDARTNTGITSSGDVPVFRLDDQMVLSDAYGLWDAGAQPLLNPVAINETGALQATNNKVFTGCGPYGELSTLHLGATNVEHGKYLSVNHEWVWAQNDPATASHPFYAVSAPLTVPEITTEPSGLNPGDQYRLIFVTSTTRNATSSNMADYNAFVTGVANSQPELAALNTQWFAVGGTATTSARTNTGIVGTGDAPVFRLDDQMVVNDAFDLWRTLSHQSLLNPVMVNETGASQVNLAFTGSSFDGTIGGNPLGATKVDVGDPTNVNIAWLRSGQQQAVLSFCFYAVSAPITVPDHEPIGIELAGNLAPSGTHEPGQSWVVQGANLPGGSLSRAAVFSPVQDGTLETVQVALLATQVVDDVRVELRDDVSGAPGSVIEGLGVQGGFPQYGTTSSGQTTFLSSLKPTLLAGTNYWIVCSPADPDTQVRWAWNDKGEQGGYATQSGGSWTAQTGTALAFEVSGFTDDALPYCTAGISASGCQATLSAPGTASASSTAGFVIVAAGVEGAKDAVFFYGTNGRQANPWGNGSSYQCVVPPVKRGGMLAGSGTAGACDGTFGQDLNVLWTQSPQKNPGAGTVVQAQLWYRDPFNTSNQTTSLSNAIEFAVQP
jgi:hypothetical protein